MRRCVHGSGIVILLAIVLATATLALGAETAFSQGARPYRTVWDDFRTGFSVTSTPGAPGARWFYSSAGPYVGDDGLATTSDRGLRVVPKGTNPRTGQPAFTRTLGQEPSNGGLPGGLDHVKWLVYANNIASTTYPGFDAVPGQDLACETWLSGRTFGTAGHPFGARVRNPNDDLRLSGVAFNAIDFETFLVADFFVTNERIYALYERLLFGRPSSGGTLGEYASFTFTVPVGTRSIGDQHHLKIAYDRSRGIMRWLVRLSTAPNFYFHTGLGQPTPQTFADPNSRPSN